MPKGNPRGSNHSGLHQVPSLDHEECRQPGRKDGASGLVHIGKRILEHGKIIINANLNSMCDLLLCRITDMEPMCGPAVLQDRERPPPPPPIHVPYGQLIPHKINDWFDMPTSLCHPHAIIFSSHYTMPPSHEHESSKNQLHESSSQNIHEPSQLQPVKPSKKQPLKPSQQESSKSSQEKSYESSLQKLGASSSHAIDLSYFQTRPVDCWLKDLGLSVSYNLKKLMEDIWLSDKHINVVNKILYDRFPSLKGFHNPPLLAMFDYSFMSSNENFVQISNIENQHWVCFPNILSSPGVLEIYDIMPFVSTGSSVLHTRVAQLLKTSDNPL